MNNLPKNQEDKTQKVDEITLKSRASYHANVTILAGCIALIITTWLVNYNWQQARLVMVFLIMTSIVITFIGIIKKFEPKISLSLTPDTIHYHHRYGQWFIPWSSVKRISGIHIVQGVEHQALPYFGLQLNELSTLIDSISPRLANRIIHEQKGLLLVAVSNDLITMDKAVINFEKFNYQGQIISGPKAAFLHQVTALNQAYGFHLYIPHNSVHLQPEAFLNLMTQCHCASVNKH